MTGTIGRTRWTIAEGYIPPASHGREPQMTSHETACVPIVVQHTRLDSRQAENALMTTMAWPAG